ncbi:MAG TPA: DNA-binding response regulator [Erysipelotrichaceae bacterium]|nr:DNA-binding response regulator [Erysipelotrichaceae bacterium]
MANILFVDDEINLRKLVSYDLKQAGFDFSVCENGEEALGLVRKQKFDLCVIDWMMPKLSGLDLVKTMRKEGSDAILIMLTAKDEEEDLIDAFDAGVDDYVRKPFSSRELMLRINAHLKRLKLTQTTNKSLGDVHLDLAKRTCLIKEEMIMLTKIEYDLLLFFIENVNQVLSRDMILNALWNFDYDGDTRIVDVHVFKLKSKMKTSLLEFKSIRGIGYQLEVNNE